MNVVRTAAGVARMLGFHVRQLARTAFFLQLAITAPLSFMLLRCLGSLGAGAEIGHRLWFDGATAGIWASTTTAVGLLGYQRFQGTLQYLVFTRLPQGLVFGALTAAAAIVGLIGLPIALAVQLLLGPIDAPPQTLIAFVLSAIACAISAGLLSSLFVLSRRALAFEPVVLIPIWLIVGLVVPLRSLPLWLQPIALLHPLTGAVAAAHQSGLAQATPWLAASLAADIAWIAAAFVLMRFAVRRATVDGTLGLA